MTLLIKRVTAMFIACMAMATFAGAQSPRYGIVTGGVFENQHIADLDDLGAGSIRLDLYWHAVEPQDNVFDWDYFEPHLDRARSTGRQLYVTIQSTPAWAGGCSVRCMPNEYAWYSFLVEVFMRYGHYSDIVWGVWNEPNADIFLDDDPVASNYAILFREADSARNAVNPNIRLGGPETLHNDGTFYFHQAMDRISPYMRSNDVVTTHWYGPGNLCGYMAEHASRAGGREVWLTETGSGDANEWTQGSSVDWLARQIDQCNTWNRTFIYRLTPGVIESILNPDGSRRQAYWRYRDYIGFTTGWSLIGPFSFKAINNQYFAAENNGNDIINANRDNAGPWETFYLLDRNAGTLNAGDQVCIFTSDRWSFQALGGGGHWLRAVGRECDYWEQFTLVKLNGGGQVDSGDTIAIQTIDGHYVVAEGGGGSIVNANRTAIGAWETFTIIRW